MNFNDGQKARILSFYFGNIELKNHLFNITPVNTGLSPCQAAHFLHPVTFGAQQLTVTKYS
jgi:hypothetical protein